MYLSKISVFGASSRNPYEIHRVLWKLFPDDPAASRDFLFRVNQMRNNQAEILMQSIREPVRILKDARVIATREYSLSIPVGTILRFLVVANPVKTINDENGRNNFKGAPKKCRVPLIKEDHLQAWLQRKLNQCAKVESVLIENQEPVYFRKAKGQRAGKIQPVAYKGILKVINADKFVDLIKRGVGPAKAFGCGLLSLAALR